MADFIRFLVIAAGSIMGPMMIVVLILHYRVWKKVRGTSSGAGLLPAHVAAISLSYGIMTYALVAGVQNTLGDPFSIRLVFYLIAFLLGIVAMITMARLQTRHFMFEKRVFRWPSRKKVYSGIL